MSKNSKSRYERKIPAERLRRFLVDMVDDITSDLDSAVVSARGGCIALHLEGATINITISREKGGAE